MSFTLRPYRRFPVQCSVTYNAGAFLNVPLAYCLGFWSLISLLVLSSGPAYAEWVSISSSESLGGYTAYLDPDTIRPKGYLVKIWSLYDFKTIQTVAGNSHLSLKEQSEVDCMEERSRRLAYTFFSGNMGMGNVVSTNSDEGKWERIEPESIAQDLRKAACGKGQSSGRAHASPPSDISTADLQTQAAQGNAKAQYILAQKYLQGHGVPQDSGEAVKWYHLSAAQGYVAAQNNLGVMYLNGHGAVKDIVRAYMWFNLGALSGDRDSVRNRDIVAGRMTSAQIAEAQRLAQQCQARQFKGC